jgi:hypothetical protein
MGFQCDASGVVVMIDLMIMFLRTKICCTSVVGHGMEI